MTSPSLVAAMLERHEGRRQFVYLDTKGIETIAVGRNLRSRGLLPEEIDFLRDNDIIDCTLDLRSLFDAWESFGEARQAALIDMRFQLGADGFREFHQMIAAIIDGEWEQAGLQGLMSKWAKEAPARAQEVTDIIRSGQAPAWWAAAT